MTNSLLLYILTRSCGQCSKLIGFICVFRLVDQAQVHCLHITAQSQVRSLSLSSLLLPAHQTVRKKNPTILQSENVFELYLFLSFPQLAVSVRLIPLVSWIYRTDVAVSVAKTRTPPHTALLPAHLRRLTGDPSALWPKMGMAAR